MWRRTRCRGGRKVNAPTLRKDWRASPAFTDRAGCFQKAGYPTGAVPGVDVGSRQPAAHTRGKVDFVQDFCGREAFLTVSEQQPGNFPAAKVKRPQAGWLVWPLRLTAHMPVAR